MSSRNSVKRNKRKRQGWHKIPISLPDLLAAKKAVARQHRK